MDNKLILNTKLYIPPVRQNQICRELPNKKLEESCLNGHGIILISAPAGYGKTMLISEWIRGSSRNCTWLSLDEYDNDPVRFINYLIAAIQETNACFGKSIEERMASPKLPDLESIASYMIRELEQVEEPLILVLDDYHLISNDYIHGLVEKLLDSAVQNITIVILTRKDLPFMLSKWRARDRITELKARDLKFEAKEVKAFFEKNFDIYFDDDTLKVVEERTEGWAAGLQLIGLSMKHMGEAQARDFIKAFKGNSRFIIDYLLEEVLRRQAEHVREFLIKTCVLKRFNTELCDAVTGMSSRSIIDQLESENLFVVSLDDSRTWYRYHHLFSEFLQTWLEEDEKADIRKKAGLWFNENGFAEEALEYALEAKDGAAAESVVKHEAERFFRSGDLKTLLSWSNSVLKIKKECDPVIEAYRACCLLTAGEIREGYCLIEGLEANGKIKNNPLILGMIRAFLSVFYLGIDIDKAIQQAEEAIVLSKDLDEFFYLGALLAKGQALLKKGELAKAAVLLAEVYEKTSGKGYRFVEMGALINLVFSLNFMGKRGEALALCEEALVVHGNQTGKRLPISREIHISIGMLLYYNNKLDEARYYLESGIAYCGEIELAHMKGLGDRFYVLSLYHEGEKAKAFEMIHRLKAQAKNLDIQYVDLSFEALEIELHLMEKNHKKVEDWLNSLGRTFEKVSPAPDTYDYYTYLRALISQGRLQEAEAGLLEKEKVARAGSGHGVLITLLLLEALVQKRTGEENKALKCVEEALTLAAPEGYIRYFLDEDEEILELVHKARYAAPQFVDQLVKKEEREVFGLKKPLTNREVEILELIAAGLSNDEIAAKFYIATGTVKWHIKNIYEKLEVSKRTQALRRARQLSIIT